MKRICVFCGSSPGFDPSYMAMARRLGRMLAKRNLALVYGGASIGLMGAIADTVLEAGGQVTGVIPELFAGGKVSHTQLTDLRVVGSMHQRKALMFESSDAFIALPGGLGTLEEISELLTWAQLGLNSKPCGLINIRGYFDPLLLFLEKAVSEGFMKQEHREMVLVSNDPEDLLSQMESYIAPNIEKWVAGKGWEDGAE